MAKSTDRIDIDQLAKLFHLPAFDDVQERNWEYIANAGDDAIRASDYDEENSEAEKLREDAEQAAGEELYSKWYDAVEHVADELFGEHGLDLKPVDKRIKLRAYTLRIVPHVSWNDAADRIRETINGVGEFYFEDLQEFLMSGPWTARQAVLAHLGYIRSYPAVYGGPGPNQIYDSFVR
jgi:hypothetical protein